MVCFCWFYLLLGILQVKNFFAFFDILLQAQQDKIIRDGVDVGFEYFSICLADRPDCLFCLVE